MVETGTYQDERACPIIGVLAKAPNLRPVANALVGGFPVVESLNEHLSLEDLLQEEIIVGDYLTLLVHTGVVSIQHEDETQGFRLAGLFRMAKIFFGRF